MLLTPEEEALLNDFDNETVTDAGNPTPEDETPSVEEEKEIISEAVPAVEEEEETPEEEEAEEEEATEEKSSFSPIELKSKNVKLTVDSMDELVKLATQGLDYTKKTQMLSPFRQRIKTMEANGITEDDLALLKDMKAGDPAAFKKAMTDAGIADVYDIDSAEEKYTPKGLEQVTETQLEADDIIAEIQSDTEGSSELIKLTESISDSNFINILGTDAKALNAVYQDVKSGIAQEAVDRATKVVALNPNVSFGQAYVKSAMDIRNESMQTVTKEKEVVTPVKKDVPLGQKLKSGLVKGSKTTVVDGKMGIDDIMNMSDAELMNKIDDIFKK